MESFAGFPKFVFSIAYALIVIAAALEVLWSSVLRLSTVSVLMVISVVTAGLSCKR